jgi:hypothetical protein
VGGQQLLQCPAPDLPGDRRRIGGERLDQGIRHGTVGPAAVLLPADLQPGPLQVGEHLTQRGEPNRVGVRHALSLCIREWEALLHREGESSAGPERPGYRFEQRLLVRKGEHGLEQEHHVERAGRNRGNSRELEAAGKVAGPLTRDADGARARVHAQIRATQLSGDEPAGPGDSAAQVQHGDPRRDARPPSQGPNLCGAHEALLLDELARGVRGRAGALQGLDEWSAVLVHGFAARTRLTISGLTFPLAAV